MYTFVRQDTGLESMIQYSDSSTNSVQWFQFLRAFDQPDLSGWPLITPIKIQMLKCEKCSLEFCSPINFRRHARIHRRSLKVNKEPQNLRGLLAEFWDKCSLVERKQAVSFEDAMLRKIPGSSVIEALAGALLEPAVWALPQAYLKAGSCLLEIIQARPSITSTSSQELFSILDDACEGTFLCTGTAVDVQNFVFDGEAANSLEFRNLVARTGFLFELQLVKAWLKDKDAEALRCQKLLVEEEEASLKRQARIVERRKQKRLRKKEQKFKHTSYTAFSADVQVLSEESIPSSTSESGSSPGNGPADLDTWMESIILESKKTADPSDVEIEITDEGQHDSGSQSFDIHCSQDSSLDDLMTNPIDDLKEEFSEKSSPSIDSPLQKTVHDNLHNVVIGSISIPINNSLHQLHQCLVDEKSKVHIESTKLDPHASKKMVIPEALIFGSSHVASYIWNSQTKGTSPVNVVNNAMQNEICTISPSQALEKSASNEDMPIVLSAAEAKKFLSQRWKQSMLSDHVKLCLEPEIPE